MRWALAALGIAACAVAGALWATNAVQSGAFWGSGGEGDYALGDALPPLAQHEAHPNEITYRVALNTDPNTPEGTPIRVTLNVSHDDDLVIIAPTPIADGSPLLLFHSDNWQTPQPITIRAVDDRIDNADNVRTAHVKHDFGGYLDVGDSPRVNVVIHDDDERGVSFDSDTVTIRRHTTENYSLRLATQPQDDPDVVDDDITAIRIDGNGDIEVAVGSGDFAGSRTVSFNAETWATPQTIRVRAASGAARTPGSHEYMVEHEAVGEGEYADASVVGSIKVVVLIPQIIAPRSTSTRPPAPGLAATATATPTATASATATRTPTPEPTATMSVTPTFTATPSPSPTMTPTFLPTRTPGPRERPPATQNPWRQRTATAIAVEDATATAESELDVTATAAAILDATATAEAGEVATATAETVFTATAIADASATVIAATATREAAQATATVESALTATAEAGATATIVAARRTATAVAQRTATAIAGATATAEASDATATADARIAGTAEAVATGTVEALLTAVANAERTATAAAGEGREVPAGIEALFAQATVEASARTATAVAGVSSADRTATPVAPRAPLANVATALALDAAEWTATAEAGGNGGSGDGDEGGVVRALREIADALGVPVDVVALALLIALGCAGLAIFKAKVIAGAIAGWFGR